MNAFYLFTFEFIEKENKYLYVYPKIHIIRNAQIWLKSQPHNTQYKNGLHVILVENLILASLYLRQCLDILYIACKKSVFYTINYVIANGWPVSVGMLQLSSNLTSNKYL